MSSVNAHVRILRTVGGGGLDWMYAMPRWHAYVVSYVGIVCQVSCQAQVSLYKKLKQQKHMENTSGVSGV